MLNRERRKQFANPPGYCQDFKNEKGNRNKNKDAQRLIKIIEQPTLVTYEDLASLIKVIKESSVKNGFKKFKNLEAK